MSKISKQLASDISDRLVAPLRKESDDLYKEKEKLILSYFRKKVPAKIMKMFNEDKTYFKKFSNSVYMNGSKYIAHYSSSDFPGNSENGAYIEDKTVCDKIEEFNLSIAQKKDEISFKSTTIFNALIGLGTFKKIEENMPEAAKYLPTTSVGVALVVDYKKANQIIKEVNSKK